MAELVEQLLQLRSEAESALAETGSTPETEAWYAEFLGRKGKIRTVHGLVPSRYSVVKAGSYSLLRA